MFLNLIIKKQFLKLKEKLDSKEVLKSVGFKL